MKYLLPLLLSLGACTSGPGPDTRKIDISLRNSTAVPIEIHAKAGILGRTIRLEPGESWSGWVPANFSIKMIEVDVHDRDVARKSKPTPRQ